MYKDEAVVLLAQIVFLQSMIWYNLLLFLYEFDAANNMLSAPPSQGTGTNNNKENKSCLTIYYV
jgi:auxin efflux carrier family